MFEFDLSDLLKLKIKKLVRKDKQKVIAINKKIKEIINTSSSAIEHYKNLRYDLSDLKRVHIMDNFVLTFKVDTQNSFILFVDFDHHNNIY